MLVRGAVEGVGGLQTTDTYLCGLMEVLPERARGSEQDRERGSGRERGGEKRRVGTHHPPDGAGV